MKAGVADYLEKGQLTAPLLERAIRYAIERQQILSRLEGMNEALEARVQERTRALAETAELFERIFSMLHMAIAYLDRNFNFIRVNRRYAAADDKEEAFFPGKNHFALYPNAENEVVFRRVVETGEPYVTDGKAFMYSENPERGISYWDWSLQPVKEPDGSVSGLILSLLDVTERQHARQALEYQAYLLEHVNDAIAATDPDLRYITWNRAAERIYGWKREEITGRLFGEVLRTEFPDGDWESFIRELRENGQYQDEVVQTCKDGRRVPVDLKITPLHDENGKLTGYVSIQRDITQRRMAEEQARQAFAQVEAQAELTRLLAGANLDNRRMLEILTRRVVELIGDACQVSKLSDDGCELVPVAFYHADPDGAALVADLLDKTVNRVQDGFGGMAVKSGAPVLVPVVSQDGLAAQVSPALRPYLARFGVHSVLIVPLIVQEKLFGTLSVTRDRPGRSYSEEDQVFLEGLSGQAALLIANAALYEKAQTELAERKRMEAELDEIQNRLTDGAEAERLKLARELHDGPVQDLYALGLQLRLLDEAFPGGENNEALAGLQGMIQRVIDTLRMASLELRPPVLTRFGLAAAIRSHCEQFRKTQPRLRILLELPGETRPVTGWKGLDHPDGTRAFSDSALTERARLAMFRIYQVALTNVVRHARASQSIVRLKEEGEMVVMEIEDDGVGFVVPEKWVELARQGHLGLLGGDERAESLGGHLEVISSPGKGTIVRVIIPRDA
jgi:PAS domain S-box-containing protein